VKLHTSYLVFAVLPREWSDEDEKKAREKWKVDARVEESKGEAPLSKKALKRAARQAHKDRAAAEKAKDGDDVAASADTPMVDVEDGE
jgi:tRNA (adenine57-N1/adenine58-N1)-methyltransferase